jgi:hypothetical protein
VPSKVLEVLFWVPLKVPEALLWTPLRALRVSLKALRVSLKVLQWAPPKVFVGPRKVSGEASPPFRELSEGQTTGSRTDGTPRTRREYTEPSGRLTL